MSRHETRRAVIAIDTSTDRAGIAVFDGARVISRSWDAGRTQTVSVLPAIDELMREAHLTPADIGSVVVATGPGTFTGLRVGLSIAKGIALANGAAVIGIPTLDVTMAGATPPCVAVLPAGRGRVVYQRTGAEPVNASLAEFIDQLTDEDRVAGELPADMRAAVEACPAAASWQPRDPATLLQLGIDRLRRGDVDDAAALEPTYLHGVTVSAGPVEDRLKPRDR